MEKRAQIKSAGLDLKRALQAAAEEQLVNIKIATHNRNVFFTGEGQTQDYQRSAFRNLVQLTDHLIEISLDGDNPHTL